MNEEGARVVFDGAWQDMLNHANLRVVGVVVVVVVVVLVVE